MGSVSPTRGAAVPGGRAVIFVTVGSQTPFDRLVRAIDGWIQGLGSDAPKVFVQIGNGSYEPQSTTWTRQLPPRDFRQQCQEANLIIAHAGMGTVLTAMQFARPLVVLPRRARLHETRNDHQLATASWLSQRPGIWVAMEEGELPKAIEQALTCSITLRSLPPIAPPPLVSALRTFIDS